MPKKKQEICVVLDNVRSVHNVGSIFRTSDAAGVSKIILCGYTPSPMDRFGRKRKDFVKVSLGAEDFVRWQSTPDIISAMADIKRQGFFVVAVEQAKNSIDYRILKLHKKTAFIFGNESDGLPPAVLKKCDAVAEIPMLGLKESLNVSVSVGIILFQNLP